MGISSSFSRPDDQAWMAEATREGFLQEIEGNISAVERSIRPGVSIDHAVFEILKGDVAAARAASPEKLKTIEDAQKLDALALRIILLEAKTAAVPISSVKPTETIPIFSGVLQKPTTLPASGVWQEGLKRVEEAGFEVRKIRGDGHCAFRAYTTCLLAGNYPKDELLHTLEGLHSSVDEKTAKELNFELLERSVAEVQGNCMKNFLHGHRQIK